jgi:hypothetical protein
MNKIFRILGLAMVVSALLVVSITGAVFAAGSGENASQNQTQNHGVECICGECPCEECPVGECNDVFNNYSHQYANSGAPEEGHKYGHRYGKPVEE